jgi:tripartite-type tricarboxylate transporter receptor subunit TctC
MALLTGLMSVTPAGAEDNTKPIRLIVPFAVGGSTDMIARAVANSLSTVLGQPVVVDNRIGATGAVAASMVSRSEPDGTTLLLTNVSTSAIAPALSKQTSFQDPSKEVTAIGLVARSPMLLVSDPSLDVKDLSALVERAKAEPGKIEYASAGVGSFGHLGTEVFAESAGIRLLHVPYQGQAPSINALLSGEVKISLTSPSASVFELARSGKLKVLGMSYLQPSALAPGVPPIANTVPGFELVLWTGIVGPAKMNDAAVQRLGDALRKVLSDRALAQRFETSGSEVAISTPQEFQQLIADESIRWRKAVKAANLQSAE